MSYLGHRIIKFYQWFLRVKVFFQTIGMRQMIVNYI